MPRFLDLECPCGAEVRDFFVMSVPQRIVHLECGQSMEQVYRLRPQSQVQWDDKRAVVVYRDAQGKIHYPGRNDRPTPKGMERVFLRSMSEVRKFELQNGVKSHISEFDQGSGRDYDDYTPEFQHRESEQKRYDRFRESTRGIF